MKTLMRINNNRNLVFPALFDDFLVRDLFGGSAKEHNTANTLPAVNIKETETAYELELSSPGMDKADFKIGLENDTLTISAQRATKAEEKSDGNYTRREFSYQSFRRAFNLPENGVDNEQVSASYRDGILYIRVPKKEQVKSKAVKAIQVA